MRLAGAQLRSQMQYRASFVMETVGTFMITGLDFIMMAVLLTRFDSIAGWSLAEVAFLYGTSTIALSISELVGGAWEDFDEWVVRGSFDRFLIRPLGVSFQMIAVGFPIRRLGRVAQGVIALAFAFGWIRPDWGIERWLFFGVTLASAAALFLAIIVVGATASFWTPQTAEITNIFTYGGQFMTSYPMSIYEEWMRSLFTFVVPLALINYYPALYLLNKPDPFGLPGWFPFLSAPVAALALWLAMRLWRVGVLHYQSVGS